MLNAKQQSLLDSLVTEIREAPAEDVSWVNRTLQALHTARAEPDTEEMRRYRQAARNAHHVDGMLEIDTDAVVSMSDTGAYVQAWVWIGKGDVFDGR